uniref:Glycosyltransferase family 92 protein n=1 Tax=Ditylenchus dipsaci TaxID=166011 RepID=A0A915ELB2_9BILA
MAMKVMYRLNEIGYLYPNKPNLQQQQLVICINRIFAFEKWQLFITVMEVYRLLKVDLVSLHVISAISSIFELMKAYEAEGRLTEFNGQVLLGHECFYEYRESAEFIAILDLDDLLITTQFPTLSESFIQARADYPTAAYFTPNKMESSFIEQGKSNPRKFNILELIHRGILTAHMYADEKMVMRPKLVRGYLDAQLYLP